MVPTDEREARLWFSSVRPLDAARLRAALTRAGIPARLAFGRVEAGLHGFRASMKQAERVKAVAVAAAVASVSASSSIATSRRSH